MPKNENKTKKSRKFWSDNILLKRIIYFDKVWTPFFSIYHQNSTQTCKA